MKVTRETVRKLAVGKIAEVLAPYKDVLRIRYPGQGPMDVTLNKSGYLSVELIYLDGWSLGLGPDVGLRKVGSIKLVSHYKEGNPKDLQISNEVLDILDSELSATDKLFPLRLGPGEFVTSKDNPESGWIGEHLIIPFRYDTPK